MKYPLAFLFAFCALVSPSLQHVCFGCPQQDLAGRPLIDWNDAASQFFCRFQTVPNDYFCKYFRDDGVLKQDHDDGFCPPSAHRPCDE